MGRKQRRAGGRGAEAPGVEAPVGEAPGVGASGVGASVGEASVGEAGAGSSLAVEAPAVAVVSGGRWWARTAVIVLFLGMQVGLPLRYYLDQDPYDERFAWRMFSAVRMTPCQLSVAERGDSEVWVRPRLNETLHVVWIELMMRGRRDVLRAYARSRCASLREVGSRAEVRIELSCQLPDGTVDRPVDPLANLCEVELP